MWAKIPMLRVYVKMQPLESDIMVYSLQGILRYLRADVIIVETSVFIATHSRRMPPPSRPIVNAPKFNTMDLSVPVNLPTSKIPDQKSIQWENYGEERIIEIFELQLRFDGASMGKVIEIFTNSSNSDRYA